MQNYFIYGVDIRSDWRLFRTHSLDRPLATIELRRTSALTMAKAARQATFQATGLNWYHRGNCSDGSIYLVWPNLFEFLIASAGKRVDGRAFPNVAVESFQTYPLKAIYVLRDPGAVPVQRIGSRPLSAQKAAVELVRNVFNAGITDPERLRRQLDFAARLALTLPVQLLNIPRDLSQLPAVVNAIVADLTT